VIYCERQLSAAPASKAKLESHRIAERSVAFGLIGEKWMDRSARFARAAGGMSFGR